MLETFSTNFRPISRLENNVQADKNEHVRCQLLKSDIFITSEIIQIAFNQEKKSKLHNDL